jgi:hypothetical protein
MIHKRHSFLKNGLCDDFHFIKEGCLLLIFFPTAILHYVDHIYIFSYY